MNRFRRPAKKLPRAGNGARQVLVVITIGACLSLGVLGINDHAKAMRQAAAAAVAGNDEIYTGSILYMPDRGNTCRQLLFDNQSGRFTDNGYVDCMLAAYRSAADWPKRWSVARVRVISTGFRGD